MISDIAGWIRMTVGQSSINVGTPRSGPNNDHIILFHRSIPNIFRKMHTKKIIILGRNTIFSSHVIIHPRDIPLCACDLDCLHRWSWKRFLHLV